LSGSAFGSPDLGSAMTPDESLFPLSSELGPITEDDLFESAQVSLQVVNVSTGEEVYSWGEDLPLTPASTMKVLTSAAALKTLGGSHRYRTGLYRTADLTSEGVIEGDLYVHGTGDPTLVMEKMWKLVYDLRLAGVHEIRGDLVFDDSYFDDRHLIEGWRKDVDMAQGPAYFAPTGALSMNYNTLCIVVSPGTAVGEEGRVQLEVPFDAVTFDNQLETVSSSSRGWVRIERAVDETAGTAVYTVQGKVPMAEAPSRHYRAVHDPLAFYISTLEQLLAEQDIEVKGASRQGSLPEDPTLVVEQVSPPLSEILSHTNKYSNNFMAEQVLKTIGAEAGDGTGSTASGVEVMSDYLESLGIPPADFTLVNGSGLARTIVLRPSHINAVLIDMFHDDRHSPEFLASMSIAGVDGTLRRRFTEDELVGRVRGKTGSLNGVACLTGYFRADDGEIYALTVLANGLRRTRPMRALHDKLGEALLAVDAVPVAGGVESARISPER
jgi:D-alanyl-D-alanine carboxypeptidase/D-alanyl-D-alanine-endopeptidase (penicillin-binding protein 4)